MTIYGPGVRSAAADMFERGFGRDAVACALGIPSRAVRQWHETFRAVGREVLLDMGKARSYDWGPRWPLQAPWSIRGGRSPRS